MLPVVGLLPCVPGLHGRAPFEQLSHGRVLRDDARLILKARGHDIRKGHLGWTFWFPPGLPRSRDNRCLPGVGCRHLDGRVDAQADK